MTVTQTRERTTRNTPWVKRYCQSVRESDIILLDNDECLIVRGTCHTFFTIWHDPFIIGNSSNAFPDEMCQDWVDTFRQCVIEDGLDHNKLKVLGAELVKTRDARYHMFTTPATEAKTVFTPIYNPEKKG